MFYNMIGRFLVQNVEGILGTLNKTVARLEKAVEAHQRLGDYHDALIDKHSFLAEQAYGQATRAKRVAAKVRSLVD